MDHVAQQAARGATVTDVVTRYGRLQVPDTGTDLIGRFLARYGEWAQHEIRFVASNLAEGARVADIGAFVGTFGLGIAQLVRLDNLCFVEANPDVAYMLRDNVQRNAPVPATVVEAAVVPANGAGPPTVDAGNLGSYSLAPRAMPGGSRGRGADVPRVLSLSSLRAEYGPFDFIKLDIEGMERAVLEDDAGFVESGASTLWVECNEAVESLDLAEMLLGRGLDIWYFAFPAFAANNFLGSPAPIFPFAYESGLWVARGREPALDAQLAQAGCILALVKSREDLRAALWQTPRWGRSQWQQATWQGIVASVAHDLLGEEYDSFLTEQAAQAPPTDWTKPTFTALEEALSRSREMARSLEVLLHHDRIRMKALEEQVIGLKMAATSTLARLQSESALVRTRGEALRLAVARAEQAEAEARRIQAVVNSIHASTTWRLMSRIASFLAAVPLVRSLLRGCLYAARSGMRLVRGS